jgi:glycosyltransferase involved in cell wall biosynthesis
MDQKIRVVHCVYNEGLSSVFRAQVLGRLKSISSEFQQLVVVLTPLGQLIRPSYRRRLKSQANEARERLGIKVVYLPLAPTRLSFLSDPCRVLRRWFCAQSPMRTIFHCRNVKMTSIALGLRKLYPDVRVIADCRGVECEEFPMNYCMNNKTVEQWPRNLREQYYDLLASEKTSLTEADERLFVSEKMREHFQELYRFSNSDFKIIPSCVRVDEFVENRKWREELQAELRTENRFVVTYLGSLAWYQQPHESLRIFRIISSVVPDSLFVAITTEPEKMRFTAAQEGIQEDCLRILNVSSADVPRYMSVADIGLLIRAPSVVNRVASPVKFGEYMASGVPVIMSNGIGDFSDAARKFGLGIVIENDQEDSEIRVLISKFLLNGMELSQENCRSYARNFLDWSSYGNTYDAIYRKIASK